MKYLFYVGAAICFVITLGGAVSISDGDAETLDVVLMAIFAAVGIFLILKGNKLGKFKKQSAESKAVKAQEIQQTTQTAGKEGNREKLSLKEKMGSKVAEMNRKAEEAKQQQYELRRIEASPYIDPNRIDAEGFKNPIEFPNVMTKRDEAVYYAVPARSFTTKEKVTGYDRGSMGVSLRVAKGVTVRPGAAKAKAIREDVTSYIDGVFVVTNQRIMFMGQKGNFEIPVAKVTALNPVSDNALMICYGNYQKGVAFDETTFNYAVAAIQEMVSRL